MSYRFRLVLTYFCASGTTASYFSGSSRTALLKIGRTQYTNLALNAGELPMGTVIGRTRKDGSKAFTAQIVIKKAGAIVHREAETFDRKQAAYAWIVKREGEL